MLALAPKQKTWGTVYPSDETGLPPKRDMQLPPLLGCSALGSNRTWSSTGDWLVTHVSICQPAPVA